ncbi:MAG TPA: hypothetical protein VIZ58_09225, partial [Thermoanaerobaculia bacterium]
YLNSKWQANIGGLYQLPMGFNVGANVYARQGYPQVNTISVNPGDGLGSRLLVVNNVDSLRLKNVFEGDVRIEKVINVSSLAIALSLDVFNVTNSGTVLQRQGTVTLDATGHATASNQSIQELQAPRTVRAGARLSF